MLHNSCHFSTVLILRSSLNYDNSLIPATASLLSDPAGVFAEGPSWGALPGLAWVHPTLPYKHCLGGEASSSPLSSASHLQSDIQRWLHPEDFRSFARREKDSPHPKETTSFYHHSQKDGLESLQDSMGLPSFTFKFLRKAAACSRLPLM